ncbi:hypothetical protein Bca4012_010397 [Brassica carinata]
MSAVSGGSRSYSYTHTLGCVVSIIKWNQTNLVVARLGDDKKIYMWQKDENCVGRVPVAGKDSGEW